MGMLPGWEPDEDDKVARHFVGLSVNEVVATGRYREISKGEFKIERMVTKKDLRGSGLGS
jgi:predicted GNAT family N-acyltransferase